MRSRSPTNQRREGGPKGTCRRKEVDVTPRSTNLGGRIHCGWKPDRGRFWDVHGHGSASARAHRAREADRRPGDAPDSQPPSPIDPPKIAPPPSEPRPVGGEGAPPSSPRILKCRPIEYGAPWNGGTRIDPKSAPMHAPSMVPANGASTASAVCDPVVDSNVKRTDPSPVGSPTR